MNTIVIISWVVALLLIAVNVFIFLKLRKISKQVTDMAFPGAKNMDDIMSKMQNMTKMMGGPQNMEAQLKTAMNMFQKMQKK